MVSGEICGLSRISSKKLPGAISVNKKQRADTPNRSRPARNNLWPRYFILRLQADPHNFCETLSRKLRVLSSPRAWDSKSLALWDLAPQFCPPKSPLSCPPTSPLAPCHER